MSASHESMRIDLLKQAIVGELASRRCGGTGFRYAGQRGAAEMLYGITGAINILAALGLPLGDRGQRQDAAARMLAYREPDGTFRGEDGPGHALHMVVGALNLLGEPIPTDIAPLAPTDPAALEGWLEGQDWSSTHKEFCGQTIPLLAGGCVGAEWVACLVRGVEARLDPARPLETWCAADDPPWRVISCIYHVLSAFDAGRLPYPQPERLLWRLLELRWDEVEDCQPRTFCTDGDWALLLLRLADCVPTAFPAVMAAIRRVSARRLRAWFDTETREAILTAGTHHLYCYLWVTAVFQSAVRDHYRGGFVRDTLNDPALFHPNP